MLDSSVAAAWDGLAGLYIFIPAINGCLEFCSISRIVTPVRLYDLYAAESTTPCSSHKIIMIPVTCMLNNDPHVPAMREPAWMHRAGRRGHQLNPNHHTEDLFHAIARVDYPSWTVYVQVIDGPKRG